MLHAAQHGLTVKPEDVRTLLVTAFINLSHGVARLLNNWSVVASMCTVARKRRCGSPWGGRSATGRLSPNSGRTSTSKEVKNGRTSRKRPLRSRRAYKDPAIRDRFEDAAGGSECCS
jgi:hypothetical protein